MKVQDIESRIAAILAMKQARFNYPAEFTTLPDHNAHSGQVVEIVRLLDSSEAEPPSEDMGRFYQLYLARSSRQRPHTKRLYGSQVCGLLRYRRTCE